MKIPSMRELLEAGVHFGHQVKRWHPKMAPYIFGAKGGVHIIDLAQTVKKLEEACKFLSEEAAKGAEIIFVGTKKQTRDVVCEEAKRAGANWMSERWIGGLLTNFSEVSKNFKRLKDLEEKIASEGKEFTKKEKSMMERERAKLERFYGGVRELEKPPDILFIVDVKREDSAVKEAIKKEIPIVAICDTNTDASQIDWPIPGNDDAIKSVTILTKTIADAVEEGKKIWEKKKPKEEEQESDKAIKQ